MKTQNKVILFICIAILIGHVVAFFYEEESLLSFVLGSLTMVIVIFGVVRSKEKL